MKLEENLDLAAVRRLLEVAEHWQQTSRPDPASRLAQALALQPQAQSPELRERLTALI